MLRPKHLTRYTCPSLMWLQWALLRLALRPVYVARGGVYLRMPAGHGVECRAWWPTWMVMTEHQVRDWFAKRGVSLR